MSDPAPHNARFSFAAPLAACGLAIVSALICYFAAGAPLGLFFAGVASAAILLPYLCLINERLSQRVLIAGAFVAGNAIVWLLAIGSITILQWLACSLVLAGFALALLGMLSILIKLIRSPIAAAAIVVTLALAWLTWPIWLSPHLHGADSENFVSWLVWLHPLFAINGALPNLGTWTHQPIMYHLTNLGQDVPYTLPQSVWPCVALHGLIGTALLFASSRPKKHSAASR
jgi:hypothetical protein